MTGKEVWTHCRHCGRAKVSRPRGLCWTCYYTDGVRALYVSTSVYAKQGVGNFFRADPALPEPTDAMPGTPEKVAVLESRAAAGQRLWHPADPRTSAKGPVPGLFVLSCVRAKPRRRSRYGPPFHEKDNYLIATLVGNKEMNYSTGRRR